MPVATGKAAFINLNEHEMYQGQSTGKYSVVITLDEASEAKLADQGVKLREYEGNKQRKFASKFDVPLYDADGDEFIGAITRGSEIKIQYSLGQPNPVHGVTPYLDKIKVMELAEGGMDEDF